MKSLIILAIASLVIVSCSSPRVERKPSDIKISWQVDTTVICQEPVTAPRFSCNGKILPNPKLLGMKEVQNFLSFRKDTVISGDSLLKWGYLPAGEVSSGTKNKGSDFSWLWEILKWIFAIVGLIVAIALALLLLRWLFSMIPTGRSSTSRSSYSSESSGGGHRRDNQQQNHASTGQSNQQNQQEGSHPINVEHVEHFHVYINTGRRNRT